MMVLIERSVFSDQSIFKSDYFELKPAGFLEPNAAARCQSVD